MEKAKVLIVDDEPAMRFFLSEALSKQGYVCAEAADGREALDRLQDNAHDVVILDLRMPRMGGMETLAKIRLLDPAVAVIIVTAFGSRETAFTALLEGAYDFFTKPVDVQEVRIVVGRAAERVRLLRELGRLRKKKENEYGPEAFLGKSAPVQRLRELLLKLAQTDSTALITGESGTGKELAAHIVHYQSRRREGPFVAVNCAAIPETLLEAELFGHEKGAFTGAHQMRIGKFEAGNNGTVFLDEIGDMPLSMQTRLLRVLQERTFDRVGGTTPVRVDIRLLAATNRDLAAAMKTGAFREDLYYRLNVVPVHIPPLRDRPEDIAELTEFFLRKCGNELGLAYKRCSPGALAALMEYRWPGNVRELDNIIQRAVILSAGEEVTEQEIRAILGCRDDERQGPAVPPDLFKDAAGRKAFSLQDTLEKMTGQVEKRIIEQALSVQDGKRQETADLLKISRKSLHNKMKKYGIE
jgi:DNA-binding NtrC family response regulator